MAYKYYGEHSYKSGRLFANNPKEPDEVSNKSYTEFAVGKLRGEVYLMRKVFPYMYYADLSHAKYTLEEGKKFYEEYFFEPHGCSTVKLGSYIGRNLDWNYDERASIVLRSPGDGQSGQGVSNVGCIHNLDYFTEEFAENLCWLPEMNILPWLTMDGMNTSGVFISMHVVSDLYGQITDTSPGQPKMPIYMLPRLVIDKITSLSDLPTLCAAYSWWARPGHEVQFFVSQSEYHMVISFKNNQVVFFTNMESDDFEVWPDDSCVALTNFAFVGWDGQLITGLTHGKISPEDTTLSPHAMGTERYELIKEFVSTFDPDGPDVDSEYIAEELMSQLHYTNAYATPWYSEFSGEYSEQLGGDLTIYRDASDYATLMEVVTKMFDERTRDGKTWYTKYSTVYDTVNGTLLVQDEEGNQEYFDIAQS